MPECNTVDRRTFLGMAAAGVLTSAMARGADKSGEKPLNLVFVFGDQWRAQATGYMGDPNVKTPRIDALAQESVNCVNTVSGCPVCSPYRGTLMTGQYPLTHGVFMNDVYLRPQVKSFAEALNGAGYHTGYIGKWHIDGQGRSSYIPPERRQGFQFWKVLECTHNYNKSKYYGDKPEAKMWEGYDAFAQTDAAVDYIEARSQEAEPFALFLSWGPPHNPYQTAPEKYNAMYDPQTLELRPNVPPEMEEGARRDLAGYYAHCTALDDALGRLLDALEVHGVAENTLVVFTSDHGDMLGSHGEQRKQRPYEESIRVPLLLRSSRLFGNGGRKLAYPVESPDLMPSILGLLGAEAPAAVEGRDLSAYWRGEAQAPEDSALLACYQPFGEWKRSNGGKEYRGIRTERYTYVRDLEGPWLLYDNEEDPYQLKNLVNDPPHAELQAMLESALDAKLDAVDDDFERGPVYLARWGYEVDETGTVPYKP
ncbi:MAG: sulfatase [Candidatus Hydrogenedentota bacterium]